MHDVVLTLAINLSTGFKIDIKYADAKNKIESVAFLQMSNLDGSK